MEQDNTGITLHDVSAGTIEGARNEFVMQWQIIPSNSSGKEQPNHTVKRRGAKHGKWSLPFHVLTERDVILADGWL